MKNDEFRLTWVFAWWEIVLLAPLAAYFLASDVCRAALDVARRHR